jgi:hypothetical protein
MQWWFCLVHKRVEQGAGCPDEARLGPYESEALAEGAVERMKARQESVDLDED